MEKHVLILCLLGNPYQNTEGGFHKTVYEIIEYFKDKDVEIIYFPYTKGTSSTQLRKIITD